MGRFMILRYSGVFALVPGLFFTSLQNQHCQVAASLGEVGVVLVTGSAGIIFAYRVFAIWRYSKPVVILVSVLYVFMVVCWVCHWIKCTAQHAELDGIIDSSWLTAPCIPRPSDAVWLQLSVTSSTGLGPPSICIICVIWCYRPYTYSDQDSRGSSQGLRHRRSNIARQYHLLRHPFCHQHRCFGHKLPWPQIWQYQTCHPSLPYSNDNCYGYSVSFLYCVDSIIIWHTTW